MPSGSASSPSSRPPRSPPGANTSPLPVMIRAARSGSLLTRRTAFLRPKYIVGGKAPRAGRWCTRRWRRRARTAAPRSPGCRRSSQRRLVEDVLGQAHVGRIDQLAVAPDGAHPLGLGLAVGLDRRLGVGDLVLGGGEDLVGDGDLAGVDRPLPVEAEEAG